MITSMTAFGRMQESGEWGRATWEIKTVNHRYLEMNIRLPEELRPLEITIREHIAAKLGRGKVDCTLRYEPGENSPGFLNINSQLAGKLINAADSLEIIGPVSINPLDILRWPGVIENEIPDPDIIGKPLLNLLNATLELIIETRQREGTKIQNMIEERCEAALHQVQLLRSNLPAIVDGIRDRYLQRAREIQTELDNDRLEQEMLLLAQKMDVAEEMDRLVAHIEEVKRVLQEDTPVGRRLDFLMQEMNREANTLGSKAANVEMSNVSVELKVLIEQMREQIQNIE